MAAFNPYNLITGIQCPSCTDGETNVEMEHQPSRHDSAGVLVCPQCQYSEDASIR